MGLTVGGSIDNTVSPDFSYPEGSYIEVFFLKSCWKGKILKA